VYHAFFEPRVLGWPERLGVSYFSAVASDSPALALNSDGQRTKGMRAYPQVARESLSLFTFGL
jgi:hypothetical protein